MTITQMFKSRIKELLLTEGNSVNEWKDINIALKELVMAYNIWSTAQ